MISVPEGYILKGSRLSKAKSRQWKSAKASFVFNESDIGIRIEN